MTTPRVPASETPSAGTREGIAIDIGGTKTRGLLLRDGMVAADHTVGSANTQNVSREEAELAFAELFAALSPSAVDRVVVGAGGADTEADKEALASLVAPHAPGARITVVHDSELLLAAAGARTGVAVIAGTGSAAWGRNDAGEESRSGGWGYLLGDEGSGYWLSREAVRLSLRRMNSGLDATGLALALCASVDAADVAGLIAAFHDPEKGRRYWAGRSRIVVEAAEQGDEGAQGILAQASGDLVVLAASVLERLGIHGPVVLGGGLGQHVSAIQNGFREGLARLGYHDVRILEQEPVFGAAALLDAPA
ncbi:MULTISPECIES: BadF/BadG/BcrA/BcrD ATPase family protein [Arthrobacter]|uniref:BadF/BadG/BcrA/BcrD ATPase family protein n=2 Tax=Arthrobacter TaxID=1663 RepID=A0ABU9KLM5_9MICC|nr:BadF/BadG/BcrA/BcrD ATPase family protein [Arthrobacter sp. YJM1]MDP5227080.1 BadF/BadG/BcrA/BcrD ATPase family protein [Arthrobacter sp. YJM1]